MSLSKSSVSQGSLPPKQLSRPPISAGKLARHHRDAASTFWGWNRIWLRPDFRGWNIEEYLSRIKCPILAIQGLDDHYGTMAQVQAIARQSGGPVEILPLAECRHSPQRDQPEATLAAIAKFVKQISGNKSESGGV
jgi:pimeloyl-ACP methyl ester carboxylesterase